MARKRRGHKAPGVTPVKVEQGMFLTIGLPDGQAGKFALKRAAEILQRHGYRCGITSPEAILAAAELITKDQQELAAQAADNPDLESGDTDG